MKLRLLKDDAGLSLTELLVVSVLMSVIIATAYMLLGAAQNMTDMSVAQSIASDEAQHAVDTMTMEIRQAQENEESKGAFKLAEANQVQFFLDGDRDGRPELVTYYVSGTSLVRTVAQPTNASTPFTFGTASAPVVVIKKLSNFAGPIFCYHGVDVDAAAVCVGGYKHGFNVIATTDPYATFPKIAMVGIYLQNQQASGGKVATVSSDVVARVRAVQNAVK